MGLVFALAVRRQWDTSDLASGDVKALALDLLGAEGSAAEFCAERWALARDECECRRVRGDALLSFACSSGRVRVEEYGEEAKEGAKAEVKATAGEGERGDARAFYEFVVETGKVLQIAGTRRPAVRQLLPPRGRSRRK